MNKPKIVPFLAVTFGLTWGILALLIFYTDQMVAWFGEIGTSNPAFILAVYAPGLAGVGFVAHYYGLKKLGAFFRRLTCVRVSAAWWAFLILGFPSVVFAGAAIKGTPGDAFPLAPWAELVPALGMALFLGPIEEFGWRGYLQPLLQRRFAPFWAGLLVGTIWAVWHTPAFLLSGTPQSAWSFAPFFGGVVACSIILTALFNDTRGSLFFAVLFHFQMMNPIWPDAQPWDNVLYIGVAVVLVILKRDDFFDRSYGVSDVLDP
jgi:hypothetical protein